MFNPNLPLSQARTLPASAYFDSTGDRSLAETWQYISSISQVACQGDYITCKINGNPLLFVRDQGAVKGFHNVCRHHAATILKGCGQCTKLRCPYHGWTYD